MKRSYNETHKAPQRARECLLAPFEVSSTDVEQGTYRGLATVFDREFLAYDPTRYEVMPTVVHKGAFTKTLAENGARIKILYQHEDRFPIGKPLSLTETDQGLAIEAWLDREQRPDGMNPYSLLKNGIIDEQSIGFTAIKSEYDSDESGNPIRRHLREVKLDEISLVTWGANAASKVTEVQQQHNERKDQAALEQFVEMFRRSGENESMRLFHGALWLLAEQHAGKVLSAINKQLVSDAVAALQALSDAAEPPAADDNDAEHRALTAERHNAEVRLVEINQQLGG
jgi:HK97 family phage prohead protease